MDKDGTNEAACGNEFVFFAFSGVNISSRRVSGKRFEDTDKSDLNLAPR
jgi:hypothetical protein